MILKINRKNERRRANALTFGEPPTRRVEIFDIQHRDVIWVCFMGPSPHERVAEVTPAQLHVSRSRLEPLKKVAPFFGTCLMLSRYPSDKDKR